MEDYIIQRHDFNNLKTSRTEWGIMLRLWHAGEATMEGDIITTYHAIEPIEGWNAYGISPEAAALNLDNVIRTAL